MIAKGDFHEVYCAVRTDQSCPAGAFLDALGEGTWELDPDAKTFPSDEQIGDRDWFLTAILHWVNTGEPLYKHAVESLDDGIWEFKRGRKRLSFYDTDGDGGFEPKFKILDSKVGVPNSDYWYIPFFDEDIRLGHAFPKVSQKTPIYDLDECAEVRREDLRHDENS